MTPSEIAAARALRPSARNLAEILWLGEDRAADAELVGGKVANLSRLAGEFPVPAGFALAWDGAPLDGWSRALLRGAYRLLADEAGEESPAVAVRSSAVDEDSGDASFAGMHESYLGVTGEEELLFAVARCVASFRSERAAGYRRGRGLPAEPERVAVLVQLMVPADAAGVAFSADPVRSDRGTVVVNTSLGLGESVVGGTVTPDAFRFDRCLQLRERRIGAKARMTVSAPGGTREVTVPRRLASLPSVSDDQARAAARLALEVEAISGRPVDIEVAWAGERLFLLQSRPITTL